MFKKNKYYRIYFDIINRAVNHNLDTYEKHHIIPKSMGGSLTSDNITHVSPREHFILHRCLARMVINPLHRRKMKFAEWRMVNLQTRSHHRNYFVGARLYERIRAEHREFMKISNPMHNPEVIKARTGVKRPAQSVVATLRNQTYWETRKRPSKILTCKQCLTGFDTVKYDRQFCSKSCRAVFCNAVRKAGKLREQLSLSVG